MTKSTKILILIMAIVLIVFGVLIAVDNVTAKADDTDSKQIAEYSYQMNELRKAKEKCFDELTLQETKDYLNGFTKPCVQYDEQIMAIREKADELKAKSYDGGL